MTKWQLFSALCSREVIHNIPFRDGVVSGKVMSIEVEDNSGHNFNVLLMNKSGERYSYFVRTID